MACLLALLYMQLTGLHHHHDHAVEDHHGSLVHFEDAGLHHSEEAQDHEHAANDWGLEVKVLDHALKVWGDGLPVAVALALLLLLLPLRRERPPLLVRVPPRRLPRYALRPPSNAPPR